ncbi:gag-protease polyprotein [Cucumis melo var. makuwa]|uniref:Gag-protease polyprotein n=1 Tax=Cucumis melo var. makuwa TaxID=1194695 RepID=A0A5A7T4T5_CUCMM|nr:gag-protease polyprotein [Cucumis melo var. makuwa]
MIGIVACCLTNPASPCLDSSGTPAVSDRLSAEAKHLRDFRKYNPMTFDRSIDDPTKAQMWLTSIETIFRYMKCLNGQKFQCVFFFLEDRGTAWWETAERMLGGDQEFLNLEQGNMTVEQYDAEFDMLSRFAPDVVKDEAARIEKFVRGLRLDLLGFVRAFRPTTHADALRLAVDMSWHERANSSKAVGRGSTPGKTLTELPVCRSCGRSHRGRCLAGSGVCYKCKQPRNIVNFCPQKLLETTSNQTPTP